MAVLSNTCTCSLEMDCAAPASFIHTHTTYAVCPLSAKRGNWRRAKRTRESSVLSPPPPSACQMQLAEGVEFLEKYAHLDHWEAPIGGRGRVSKWRVTGWARPLTTCAVPYRHSRALSIRGKKTSTIPPPTSTARSAVAGGSLTRHERYIASLSKPER